MSLHLCRKRALDDRPVLLGHAGAAVIVARRWTALPDVVGRIGIAHVLVASYSALIKGGEDVVE